MEHTATTPRPLTRPRTDRVVAGVAAGVARRLDVSLPLVRALFVITAFFGGLGLAAYLTGWLLMPDEGETDTAIRRWFRRASEATDWSTKLGWALITLAAVVLVAATGILSTPLVVAAVLVIAGVSLVDRSNERDNA